MALQKDIVISSEQTLSYHRILRIINLDQDEHRCVVLMVSYVDAVSRANGDLAQDACNFSIVDSSFDQYFADTVLKQADKSPVSQAYEYIKTLPEWSGAVDC